MELRQLRAFAAVVSCGGFSAAATEIGSTQSSVSKAILQLEHDCGAQLLERLPNGVKPTDAGRIVLDRARIILTEHERISSDLDALRGLETGCLRIGMPLIGSGVLFASVFADFLKRFPQIKIELREGGGKHLETAVQSGEIEIAASLLPAPQGFRSYKVCDEPLVAVLPTRHPLAGRERVRIADLAEMPCILFEQGFALNAIISAAYARRSIPLVEAARSAQPDFMLSLAAAGMGVVYMPRLMVAGRSDLKTVLVDEPNFRWKLGLIWRSDLSPAARRFLEIAKSRLPASQGTFSP